MKKYPCSGIILTGSESNKMNSANKAGVEVGGQRILDRLLTVFGAFFDEIILVTADPSAYLEWDVLIVADHFETANEMTGIYTGLFTARCPHALVATCDMPLVQPTLLKYLLDAIEPRWDAIVPLTENGLEPLPAVYSKRCLKPMEQKMAGRLFSIQRFIQQAHTKTIDQKDLRRHDPELVSFTKTDSPAELAQALDWLNRHPPMEREHENEPVDRPNQTTP